MYTYISIRPHLRLRLPTYGPANDQARSLSVNQSTLTNSRQQHEFLYSYVFSVGLEHQRNTSEPFKTRGNIIFCSSFGSSLSLFGV